MQLQTTSPENKFPNEYTDVISFKSINIWKSYCKNQRGPNFMNHGVHMLNRYVHARHYEICSHVQNLITYYNFSPLTCLYVTFIALRRRIRGISTFVTKSSENFQSPKFIKKYDLLRPWLEMRGYEEWQFSLQKAHPCVNTRRLSHFAWRSVGGLTPRAEIKKVRKSRTPIGMMCLLR